MNERAFSFKESKRGDALVFCAKKIDLKDHTRVDFEKNKYWDTRVLFALITNYINFVLNQFNLRAL
jgi:hypothetical protein